MANVIKAQDFVKNVKENEGVAVVDFFATWCGPCNMLGPVFAQVAEEQKDVAYFAKVDVDENSKTIKVTLPESKVLSNELDLKSLKVYDEKNSIFNPVKVKEYSEFTQSGKENAEKDARESGVFEQSKEVAKKIITDLLNTTKEIKENYKIVFE